MFREQLQARLPKSGALPPQPVWKPKQTDEPKRDAENWKNRFFEKHPAADVNKDGKLSWPEFKAHKGKLDAKTFPKVNNQANQGTAGADHD